MATNSVYFQVIDQGQRDTIDGQTVTVDNIGWQVRVRDMHYNLLAVIPEFVEVSAGPELCAAGAGSITLDRDHEFWATTLNNGEPATSLLDFEHLWCCYENGSLRYEFLGRAPDETEVSDDEARPIKISGPGAAEAMRFGKIMPPGFPKPPPSGLNYETAVTSNNNVVTLGWEFPFKWPAMQMWWTLFKSCQSRGVLTFVNPTFTDTADSAGSAWVYVPTVETESKYSGYRPTQGTDLLDFLNQCTGQDFDKHFADRNEWVMHPGFRLECRKVIGVNRSGVPVTGATGVKAATGNVVRFFEGNLLDKQRVRSREEIANFVVVIDQDGNFSTAADTASIKRWGIREDYRSQNLNITVASLRDQLAHAYLEQTKLEKSEWTITVPYGLPGRRPFVDFNVGDWIGIGTYTAEKTTRIDGYRVLAIVVTVDANGYGSVELTLQSKIEARLKQLEARVTTIINTINNTQPKDTKQPPGGDSGDSGGSDIDFGHGIVRPSVTLNSLLSGAAGLGRVWIQATDPGDKAAVGDFWYNTAFTNAVTPQPATEPKPPLGASSDTLVDSREVPRSAVPPVDVGFGL